jgi:transcriptional regulator with XRE-family HTH domain
MTTSNRQRVMLTLPDEVADAFETFIDNESRYGYIKALRDRGWTLQSIADVADYTRERVRQIAKSSTVYPIPPQGTPLPYPPEKPETRKETRVPVEPEPETLARLLELQPNAQKVRANSSNYREEAEEYTRLIHEASTTGGVTLHRLAMRLGVTRGALRSRLARYDYKPARAGSTSKAYTPIKRDNRVDS